MGMRRYIIGGILCCIFLLPLRAWAIPDFEEDLTLGMEESALRALGAKPCTKARLCTPVLWGEKQWDAMLHLRGSKLESVEIVPRNIAPQEAVRLALELLDEFALVPVRVTDGQVLCDAFDASSVHTQNRTREVLCAKVIQQVAGRSSFSVWYVDEEGLGQILQEKSREKAAQSFGTSPAARVVLTGEGLAVVYGSLEGMLLPAFRR